MTLTTYDPDTAAMRDVAVARYAYDSTGRLRQAWDPRQDSTNGGGTQHAATTYAYDADGELSTLTPPGQELWQFAYTTLPSDPGKGRLARVSRSALGAGTSTTTVVYGVPVAGAGAPNDLSPAARTAWGQDDAPATATAIFDAGQAPTGNQATGQLPGSYERATIVYLDPSGRTVNTANPGGFIDTSWYDKHGNVVRGLSALGRQTALSTSGGVEQQAAVAVKLSRFTTYDGDGTQILQTLSPQHPVALADGTVVTARTRTTNAYDEGAPATGGPFNLVTTVKTGAQYTNAAGTVVDADVRTTRNTYDWTLGALTSTTQDPGGLNLVESTGYNTAGKVTSRTLPGAAGSATAATTVTVYYRAGTGSGYAECDNRPYWADLPCREQPGGQPAAGPQLPVTVTTYAMYGQPRTVEVRNSGGTLRTTTNGYDAAGRLVTVAVSGPAGSGTAVATTRTVYDPATGLPVRTESLDGTGAVTAKTVRAFDTLGRVTSYTDADGSTTTTTYDVLSRTATVADGRGTRTFHYDEGTERRNRLTSVTDAQLGTIAGEYDANGVLFRETWPTGVVVTRNTDETGNTIGVAYTQPGCGRSDCTLYSDYAILSAHDQRRTSNSTLSSQVYGYDAAGRIALDTRTVSGRCTSRAIGYTADSARSVLNTFDAATDGGCQMSTQSASRSWTYDAADRVTSGSYTYDELGRTTTLPGADTGNGGGTLNTAYYLNDMARTLTQDGRTATYQLDVQTNRFRSWTDTAAGTTLTRTNHYSDDSDTPSWTDNGGGTYTRTVTGLSALTATVSGGTATWQVQNLHGDVVATMTAGTAGLASAGDYDEFGQPQNATDAGTRRYGWLGSAQRAADTPGAVTLMGARLYTPGTGRFLSKDPVYGGNANPYDYCTGDPVRCTDTTGLDSRCSWKCDVVNNSGIGWLGFKPIRIARDRCSHFSGSPCPSSPQQWLNPGQSSTRFWKDTDSYRVYGIWHIAFFTENVSVAPWMWS